MKLEKVTHVLEALQDQQIRPLDKEALIRAFNDDGIADLEGVVEHLLIRIREDIDVRNTEPRLVDFAPLTRRTSPDAARTIAHTAPTIPFTLNGVVYEPADISRFDGQALVFVPIVARDGRDHLQLFTEEIMDVIAGYLQTRQVAGLINPNDFPGQQGGFPEPPGPTTPRPPGTPPPGVYCHGGTTGGIVCPPGGDPPPPSPPPPPVDPPAPFKSGEVQMFDDMNYSGNWFWLARGHMWSDLTIVGRGGWFGGDWSDAISSLGSTDTSCIYCEHVNLDGSKLFLGPQKPIPYLAGLGWNDRISSVWNFEP